MLTQRATRSVVRDASEAQFHVTSLPAPSELSDALDLEHQRKVFPWAAEPVRNWVVEHTWQAFWLMSIEDLSISDAAIKLNTRTGNIYFARSRVMARIKEIVKDYYDSR